MEALTRLVSESLARNGFDRPVDYRRLQWSNWLRCESLQSLLAVPSKPGIFAVAQEAMEFGKAPVGTVVPSYPGEQDREGHDFSRAIQAEMAPSLAAEGRVLSVHQFQEANDMAYVLDRMLSRRNSLGISGSIFIRFVVLEDTTQRRSICQTMDKWLVTTAGKMRDPGFNSASLDASASAHDWNPAITDAASSAE